MININETSANSKIYIQRNITNDEPVINNYVTEDELQEILKEYNSIPYIVVDGFSDSLGFKITKGDWDAVHNAIQNNKPYLIYARSSNTGTIFSLVDDIIPHPQGGASIATTLITANRKITYRAWTIDIDGNVELRVEETYTIQPKLVSGENIKTINGNDILGEGDITIESNVDLSDYYTKGETDNKYQPKGNYLTSIPEEYVTDSELTEKGYATEQWVEEQEYAPLSDVNYLGMLVSGKQSTIPDLDEIRTGAALGKTAIQEIPSEYITETELNDALANVGGGIPYLWVTYNETDGYKYIGSFTDVIDAIVSQKPFIVYVPSGIHNYYTTLELVEYNQYMINGVGYTHTYDTNYFTQWMLYKDSTQNKRLNHINEYAEKSYVDEQLGNINNLLENIIG